MGSHQANIRRHTDKRQNYYSRISPTKELVWKKDIQQNEQGMTELVLEESGWYNFLATGKTAGGSFYLSWDVLSKAEK